MPQNMEIDARGAFCPGPLMELIAALKTIDIGDEVTVLSSDKGSTQDIPEWIKKVGHKLTGIRHEDNFSAITIRKEK